MGNPTRFKNGVSTASATQTLANYPLPNPTSVYTDGTDFAQYVAGDWTVTNTTSHYTVGLVAGAGGIMKFAAGGSTVSTDIAAIISNPLDFNFATTNQVWFSTKIKATTAATDLILVGLTSANATAAVSDGIYFTKAAGAATIDFVVKKSNTATTVSSIATLANDTFIQLGFYYNGKDAVDVFVNDVKVYSQTTLTNLPSAVALGQGAALKAAAGAPTSADLSIDWLMTSQDR